MTNVSGSAGVVVDAGVQAESVLDRGGDLGVSTLQPARDVSHGATALRLHRIDQADLVPGGQRDLGDPAAHGARAHDANRSVAG